MARRVEGARLDFLRAIRAGEFGYDGLVGQAAALIADLEKRRDERALPGRPRARELDALLHEITSAWERDHDHTRQHHPRRD